MRGAIYQKYWFISGSAGLMAAAVAILGSSLLKETARVEVARGLTTISVTFALTFVAFSFTALALLQLLQDREYFSKIRQSEPFKSFLARFFLSVKLNIALLLSSVLIHIFQSLFPVIVLTVAMAYLAGFMAFIASWIWTCLSTFITLFKE